MLGRYVAGTLLILGVAMLMAPPAPETPERGAEVARGESAPSVLAAPARVPVTAASAPEPTNTPAAAVVTRPAVASAPDAGSDAALEAAILEALNLDQSEKGVEAPLPETGTNAVVLEAAADEDVLDEAAPGVLAGLGDPGFLASPTTTARAAETPSVLLVTGNRVNVREGPSTLYRVIGTVFGGDEVEVVSIADDWAQVRLFDGAEGYMARSFLSAD